MDSLLTILGLIKHAKHTLENSFLPLQHTLTYVFKVLNIYTFFSVFKQQRNQMKSNTNSKLAINTVMCQ